MKGPGHFIGLGCIYILIGVYFLVFSDYPWFILLFAGLAAYHFFLARIIKEWRDRGKGVPKVPEVDDAKFSEDGDQQASEQ